MIDLLHAIVLGVIEGLTEFLPISSTGHLILAEKVLNFKDIQDLFTVVVQVGAIFAVVWYFRRDIIQKLWGLYKRDPEALHFWKLLVIGTIPAGLVGLALDKSMEKLTTPFVVALALVLGGITLWLVDRKPASGRSRRKEETIDFNQISIKRALLIGAGQCVAIVPGVSRSGATIVSGLATGLNRPTATAFSFYLSIPVLILASGYKIAKYSDKLHSLPGGSSSLAVGLVFAFITGLLSVSWLLKYISHHNFKPFAYYRIVFGVVILALIGLGYF